MLAPSSGLLLSTSEMRRHQLRAKIPKTKNFSLKGLGSKFHLLILNPFIETTEINQNIRFSMTRVLKLRLIDYAAEKLADVSLYQAFQQLSLSCFYIDEGFALNINSDNVLIFITYFDN